MLMQQSEASKVVHSTLSLILLYADWETLEIKTRQIKAFCFLSLGKMEYRRASSTKPLQHWSSNVYLQWVDCRSKPDLSFAGNLGAAYNTATGCGSIYGAFLVKGSLGLIVPFHFGFLLLYKISTSRISQIAQNLMQFPWTCVKNHVEICENALSRFQKKYETARVLRKVSF